MTPTLERPRLRPYLEAVPDVWDPGSFHLRDERGLLGRPQRVSRLELVFLSFCDGRRTLQEIHVEVARRVRGPSAPLEHFAALVRRMDEALLLDGPRFRQHINGSVRPPSCLGTYPEDPAELRRQVAGLFTAPGGPGLPGAPRPNGRLRAVLVPHMDYGRGGVTYGWGYKELAERTDAALFVIVGTSHLSGHRFTLTRKHFQTPLGTVETDAAFVDRVVAHYGDGLFDDEIAHLPEWSIELEVVLLQYLFADPLPLPSPPSLGGEGRGRGRPFRIVPLLVGPFHDCTQTGSLPRYRDDVGRMIEALRRAEAETPEPVCWVISGDLAHIGPKFRDLEPVSGPQLAHSRRQDEAILAMARAADPAGYFRVIADEADARRICGLPPTYTVLEAVRPTSGKVLHYNQFVHPTGFESVSYASAAFYR
ncbi:MAG TPA: AmmeMemoRadiSam system protein B [Gemmataceae bacterium]|nr:AmmeMemoRadiSam system protein B [Gemmataceae bacterium]